MGGVLGPIMTGWTYIRLYGGGRWEVVTEMTRSAKS